MRLCAVDQNIMAFSRFIPKEDIWLSILSHSTNSLLNAEHFNDKFKKKNYSKQTTECFPVKTREGTKCCHDTNILNYGVNPPNSMLITITLSPTDNQVKKKKKSKNITLNVHILNGR